MSSYHQEEHRASSSDSAGSQASASSSSSDITQLDSTGSQASTENNLGPFVQNKQAKERSKREKIYQKEVEEAPYGQRPCMYNWCSGTPPPGKTHKLQPLDQFKPVESKPGNLKTSCLECRMKGTAKRAEKAKKEQEDAEKEGNPAMESSANDSKGRRDKRAPPQEEDSSINREENVSGGIEDQFMIENMPMHPIFQADTSWSEPPGPNDQILNHFLLSSHTEALHLVSQSAGMMEPAMYYGLPPILVPAPEGNVRFQDNPLSDFAMDPDIPCPPLYQASSRHNPFSQPPRIVTTSNVAHPSTMISGQMSNTHGRTMQNNGSQNQALPSIQSIPRAPHSNVVAGTSGTNSYPASRPLHEIDPNPVWSQDMIITEDDYDFMSMEEWATQYSPH